MNRISSDRRRDAVYRWVSCILSVTLALLLACPARVSADDVDVLASAKTLRLAVITDAANPDGLEIYSEMLTLSLMQADAFSLLERDEFQAVLDEISLSKIAGADAVAGRLDIVNLLDADALVMVHHSQSNPDRVAVTLIETRYGLRLASYRVPKDAQPEQSANELAAAIQKKLNASSQGVRLIVAVPPFVDARLDPQPPRLGSQLTEAVQATIDSLPGILVLEVDEARALAREMKVRGDDRLKALPDPIFLTGRVANQSSNQGHITLELKAERNSHPPKTHAATASTIPDLIRQGIQASNTILSEHVTQEDATQNPDDSAQIIAQLKQSAAELAMVGDASQGRDLIETAILLDPDSTQLRKLALDYIRAQQVYGEYHPDNAIEADASLERLRATIDHHAIAMDRIIRQGDHTYKNRKGRTSLMYDSGNIGLILRHLKDLEGEDAAAALQHAYELFQRHNQRLYRLVMSADDQQLKPFSARIIAGLFYYQRDTDPSYHLPFNQRFELFKRFQDRSDAKDAAQALMAGYDIEHLRQDVEKMDRLLGELSPRGLMAYEHANVLNMDNRQYHMQDGPLHRNAAIEAYLKSENELHWQESEEPREVDPSAIRARHLSLHATDPDSNKPIEILPAGWTHAGAFGELLYDDWRVYLMTGVDQIKTIYTLPPELRQPQDDEMPVRIARPCFDGRYVWIATLSDPGRLCVIDLQTLAASEYTAADGLFPMAGGVAVAPLDTGEVLISASTIHLSDKARGWHARTSFDPKAGLNVNIVRQVMPESKIGNFNLSGDIRNAATLSDPDDPSRQVVIVDLQSMLDHEDAGQKLIVSPDSGEIKIFQWGRYDHYGQGLAQCFVHQGALYFTGNLPEETGGIETVKRYNMKDASFTRLRPGFIGQGVTGMVLHDGVFMTIGGDGALWGSRSLTDIARKLGPIEPDLSEIETDDYDPWNDHRPWVQIRHLMGYRRFHLVDSRYYGLVGVLQDHAVTEEDNERMAWAIELKPEHLAALDRRPDIPESATLIGDRFLLNVPGKWSYPEARGLAKAYGGSLVNITDRKTYDRIGLLASGRGKTGHHWTNLQRNGDKLFLSEDENTEIKIEGIPLGGAKQGHVLARWNPPAITGAGPHIRMKAMLEWPAGSADTPRGEQPLAPHPGPAWMPVVELPAGRYTMGNRDPNSPYAKVEPLREVDIPAGLWMGVTEVTSAQYRHVMKDGPTPDDAPGIPGGGNWAAFCRKLSLMTGLNYRVPTEEEWEYACRAGSDTRFASGDSIDDLRKIGWCSYDGVIGSAKNYSYVRSLAPNAWGLYDMHGNFSEWTSSYLDRDGISSRSDPGLNDASRRQYIIRGGSWLDTPERCRSSARRTKSSSIRTIGFRVLLDTRPTQ